MRGFACLLEQGCENKGVCADMEFCLGGQAALPEVTDPTHGGKVYPDLQPERYAELTAEVEPANVTAPAPVLPTGSQERKDTPIYSGVLRYFPRALAYIAKVSKAGNDKHNPDEPLHWSKDKSNDHGDCVARHLIEAGTVDPEDGLRHSGKLAWRALALLEIELEKGDKP